MEACAEVAVDILDAAALARVAFLGVVLGWFRGAAGGPERTPPLHRAGAQQHQRRSHGHDCAATRQHARRADRSGRPGRLGRVTVPTLLSAKTRSRDPQFASRLAYEIDHLDRAALSRAVRSAVVERTSVAHLIGHINIPTLIIAGAEDHALPPAHSQRLARDIPGATLHVIPDIAHLAPREAPEAVAALLNDFLATVPT
jgi:3-oxoadipate enol-lactonase